MSEAARCRPQPAGRLAVARSALAGALDRSVDLAAALELRGYALGGRPARGARRGRATTSASPRPACRRGGGGGGRAGGRGEVDTYPGSISSSARAELALAAAIVLLALRPFAGRAARMGVARA